MGDNVRATLRAENAALRARLAAAEARMATLAPRDSHSQEVAEFRRAVIERAAEGICVCHAVSVYPYVHFTI